LPKIKSWLGSNSLLTAAAKPISNIGFAEAAGQISLQEKSGINLWFGLKSNKG